MSISFNKTFKITFFFIILAEFLSFFGYFYPMVNKAAFFVIVAVALAVSLYKLEYGLLIVLAELIIGSKGYLFYFEYGESSISIRMALFIIVMAVWLGKSVLDAFRASKTLQLSGWEFFKSRYFLYFLALFIFIGWGFLNGLFNKNGFANIFFDFNGWLYFLLVFPVYNVIGGARNLETHYNASLQKIPLTPFVKGATQIFVAAIVWLSFKTLFLLFIFSHSSMETIYEIYRWIRTSGVGEITLIQGGFYRIFFQSHIFTLIGFFILLIFLTHRGGETKFPIRNLISKAGYNFFKENKNFYLLFSVFCSLFSTIIITFSRSFWVGLAFGLVLIAAYLFWQKIQIKKLFQISGVFLFAVAVSVSFVALIVKFPYPKPLGDFNTAELLSQRASGISGEAAVASRWTLLPKLWKEIKTAPILGKGFGATVSYQSSDPRILETIPLGEYTTYAFEWGWLDIWLKLGIGGLIVYLFLIGKIIISGLMQNAKCKMQNDPAISLRLNGAGNVKCKITLGLVIGLLVISVVNIFTPYLNHPLGIGYLIMVSAWLESATAPN